jgi:murein DD-endopeptidase MepM/ murein hydrolase activator NlpD
MQRAAFAAGMLALFALAGCERQPVRTVVIPPKTESAALGAAAPRSTPPAPAAATPGPAPAPAPEIAMRVPGDPEGSRLLAQRPLRLPVVGVPASQLSDTYSQSRGDRPHEALDILAPRGTRVVAVDDGTIAKLFTSKPGGLTVYQFDPDGKLAYYYAHLDRYAEGLREGMEVRRGDLVGYVGSTGNADARAPHLHFAVFKLGPEKRWWEGVPVNPYRALRDAEPPPLVTAMR